MTISVDEFTVFCRRSLTGAIEVVDRLGDGLVNLRPPATNGNSPFALVTHMLGAAEWWVIVEQAPELATTSALAHMPSSERPLEFEWTVGAALLHVYEEIAQHLGHLEITADLLLGQDSAGQST